MFAPAHHGAMKNIAPVRKELGVLLPHRGGKPEKCTPGLVALGDGVGQSARDYRGH